MLKISLKQFKKFESKEFKITVSIFLGMLFAAKIFSLLYPLFLDNYPYFQPDSFSWISDGFYYAGYGTNYVVRNPAYPLLIAILQKLNLLLILPIFGYVAFLVFLYSSYEILKSFKLGRKVSLITVFLFGISWFLNLFAISILSDMYALTFINLSLLFFIKAKKDSRFLIGCLICLAISLNFQYAGFVLIPVYGLLLLVQKKKELFLDKNSYLAALGFLVLVFPWFIYRYIKFEDPFYTKVQQFELLNLHFDGILYYLYSTVVILGIPAVLIGILGLLKFFLQKNYIFEKILYSLYALAFFVFWILLYDWFDARFLIYFMPFFVLTVAFGISELVKKFDKNLVYKLTIVIFLLLSTLYISYTTNLNADTSRLLLLPNLSYGPAAKADGSGKIFFDYDDGTTATRAVDFKSFKILDSFFLKKNYLSSPNSDFEELETFFEKKCRSCQVCLSSVSKLDPYTYSNLLSITSESRVLPCQENDDKRVFIEKGNEDLNGCLIDFSTEKYKICSLSN